MVDTIELFREKGFWAECSNCLRPKTLCVKDEHGNNVCHRCWEDE